MLHQGVGQTNARMCEKTSSETNRKVNKCHCKRPRSFVAFENPSGLKNVCVQHVYSCALNVNTRKHWKSINGEAYLKSESRVTSLMWRRGFTQVGSLQYKQNTSCAVQRRTFRPRVRGSASGSAEWQSRAWKLCLQQPPTRLLIWKLQLPSLQFKMTLLPVLFQRVYSNV